MRDQKSIEPIAQLRFKLPGVIEGTIATSGASHAQSSDRWTGGYRNGHRNSAFAPAFQSVVRLLNGSGAEVVIHVFAEPSRLQGR